MAKNIEQVTIIVEECLKRSNINKDSYMHHITKILENETPTNAVNILDSIITEIVLTENKGRVKSMGWRSCTDVPPFKSNDPTFGLNYSSETPEQLQRWQNMQPFQKILDTLNNILHIRAIYDLTKGPYIEKYFSYHDKKGREEVIIEKNGEIFRAKTYPDIADNDFYDSVISSASSNAKTIYDGAFGGLEEWVEKLFKDSRRKNIIEMLDNLIDLKQYYKDYQKQESVDSKQI